MLLHVILADDDIRRVQIETLPETVDELKTALKSKLNLEGDIVIQFQDPEFNNELCNLADMSELPTERPRLKVLLKAPPLTPPYVASLDTSSDTASMSSACSLTSPRAKQWPDYFIIPTFTYDVELKLRKGNEAYKKDGSLLTVTAAMKRDILDRVGSAMYEYNAYPTSKQIEDVAKALVEKHPCLREPGSSHGWYCWKFSLTFKMGNLRQKYRIAGCPELAINQKRSSTSTGNRKLKKARRSEINFLPDIPEGKSPDGLEIERIALIEEMKKKKRDGKMMDALMDSTFALRRKEIVDGEPPVSEIEDRWPALFSERQISAEFRRLVSTELHRSFFDGLDKYVSRLLEMYKVRSSSSADLRALLQPLDIETSNQKRRAAALLGLPYYLKEDPKGFICVCEVCELIFWHGKLIMVKNN
ncbi:sterile alpha motif domain-containing protein 3-like [Centropristis striata]|uniref:sterile alpha motif domain-containing protein 3-like n=1 Tax=Centropristis striata TaxID=184440 RepID=UPI0027E021C5|nr:sterile alpha motif domain-containing protein 3-like [Centropristis striata]